MTKRSHHNQARCFNSSKPLPKMAIDSYFPQANLPIKEIKFRVKSLPFHKLDQIRVSEIKIKVNSFDFRDLGGIGTFKSGPLGEQKQRNKERSIHL